MISVKEIQLLSSLSTNHANEIHLTLSRYGEVLEINLIRDKDTGKSKGFAFLRYADPRSAILAVDNLNGISVYVYFCVSIHKDTRFLAARFV